ncbi:MAG: hypothetical protein AAF656_00705 [Planctomycetota bacterium]
MLPPTLQRYADHLRSCADVEGLRGLAVPGDVAEVVDGGGHRRPPYAGLMAFVLGRLGVDMAAFARQLDDAADWPDAVPGGVDAEALSGRAWNVLALASARDEPAVADELFRKVADQGARFADDGSNPEPRWYAELVLLHALTSFAAWVGDASLLRAAADAAAYQQAETQPDHATGQPWAIHAALLSPDTLPLADLLLLPVSLPDGRSVINRLLLADGVMALESPAFAEASTWPA